MKTKKGFLINSKDGTITEVEVTDYKDIQKKVGCDLFDVVSLDENNDVYVDDEGLLNLDKDSKFFGFKGSELRLAGNGLVLGINNNTGDSKDTTLTVEYLKDRVEFFDYEQTRSYLYKVGLF